MSRRTIVFLSASLFVALLTWGFFTFFVYLGVPAHNLVYMNPEQMQRLAMACGEGSSTSTYWCRGLESLPDFLFAIVATARPFHTYVVISFIAYLIVTLYRGVTRERFSFVTRLHPWHVFAGFFFSAWLIGTLLSAGSLMRDPDGIPFKRVAEPSSIIYNLPDEALAVLKENHERLLASGCLLPIGVATNGAKLFDLSHWCMQKSLISKLFVFGSLLSILTLNFLAVGRLLDRKSVV